MPVSFAHVSAMTRFEGIKGFVLAMPDDRAHASAMARFVGLVRGRAGLLSVSVAVLMVANYALPAPFGKREKWTREQEGEWLERFLWSISCGNPHPRAPHPKAEMRADERPWFSSA